MTRAPGLRRILDDLHRNDLWEFPVCITNDGEKRPLVPWGDYQSRPPSSDEVAEWCQRFPDAGAAIPTGLATNLLIVDEDSADAGKWLAVRGMPDTVTLNTRTGRHNYLRCPAGLQVRNSAGALYPGVDIRGDGGMAIAAGTVNPCDDGFIYHYAEGFALGEMSIAEPPKWLLNWLVEEDQKRRHASEAPVRPQQFDGKVSAWARAAIDSELAQLADAAPEPATKRSCRSASSSGS
jgi:Bifunctional DNA primase/polymerase, N-terminal